jgi:hypothetical protein
MKLETLASRQRVKTGDALAGGVLQLQPIKHRFRARRRSGGFVARRVCLAPKHASATKTAIPAPFARYGRSSELLSATPYLLGGSGVK